MKMGGLRALTGRPDDYTEPIGVVTRCISQLVHEYAQAGGDLGAMQVTVTASHDWDVRGTVVALQGYKEPA